MTEEYTVECAHVFKSGKSWNTGLVANVIILKRKLQPGGMLVRVHPEGPFGNRYSYIRIMTKFKLLEESHKKKL